MPRENKKIQVLCLQNSFHMAHIQNPNIKENKEIK